MEAPEKIYLFRNPIGVILDSWYLNPNAPFEKIEYIHKDAFIEKAKKWLYLQLNEINMEGEDMENFLKYFTEYMEE